MLTADAKRRLATLIDSYSLPVKVTTLARIASMAEAKLQEHGIRKRSRQTCVLMVIVPHKDGARVLKMQRTRTAWGFVTSHEGGRAPFKSVRWFLRLCEVAKDDAIAAIEAGRHA